VTGAPCRERRRPAPSGRIRPLIPPVCQSSSRRLGPARGRCWGPSWGRRPPAQPPAQRTPFLREWRASRKTERSDLDSIPNFTRRMTTKGWPHGWGTLSQRSRAGR
jgi:hypothetical protein